MAFTKLTKDMNIIQKLDDEPNDVGGMTSAELKAKFDEPGNAVKDWINNTFIPEAEQEFKNALLGQIPDGTVTMDKLKPGIVSNPNLLDNWYFADPVNQRGQTEYTARGYTIDRWFLSGGNTKVLDGHLKITFTTGSQVLYQPLENPQQYAGKTLTISAIVDSDDYICVYLSCYYNGTANRYTTSSMAAYPVSSGKKLIQCTAQIPDADNITSIWPAFIFGTATGGTAKLYAMKMELGSIQTLAHQDKSGNWVLNDPLPNKALELAKCQRYFCRLKGSDTGYNTLIGHGETGGGTMAVICEIRHPVPMRIKPTLLPSSAECCTLTKTTVGNGVVSTALSLQSGNADHSFDVIQVNAPLPSADGTYRVWLKPNEYIDFDANL